MTLPKQKVRILIDFFYVLTDWDLGEMWKREFPVPVFEISEFSVPHIVEIVFYRRSVYGSFILWYNS
jgi:hypothetical protein